MGKNNRARRAAKTKQRERRHGQRGSRDFAQSAPHSHTAFDFGALAPDELAYQRLVALSFGAAPPASTQKQLVNALLAQPVGPVRRAAERILIEQIGLLWNAGWMPGELIRHTRLRADAVLARLTAVAVAHDHARRRADTLDPRWVAHVEDLALAPANGRAGWIDAWLEAEGASQAGLVASVGDWLRFTGYLPKLDCLVPPPGSAPTSTGRPVVGGEIDPLLNRIRNLLAKAESTSYESEALAFTEKAQELMTRHSITAALLNQGERVETPTAIRLAIDAPYADAKSLLLQVVAFASRCRTVYHDSLQLSTVAGFATELAGVEALYTSLLVQAQAAMNRAGKAQGARARSVSFRTSFWSAYTQRIKERLGEINKGVLGEVEAEQGSAFLPALRSRETAVDDYVAERFGELTSSSVRRGYDQLGWATGKIAADTAALNSGELS